jgi:AcrR family transcriptional regulator
MNGCVVSTRRQEQARWRRERLLDAALEVFADKGIDGTSVKDIAHAAEVTPGLLYHYFDSKESLVAVLLRERGFLPSLRELLDGADDRPAAQVLPELVDGFDRLLSDNAGLVALFFAASANPDMRVALARFVVEGQRLLAGYLRARAVAGELRPELVDTAAATLFAAVAIGRRTGSALAPAELVDLVLHGLTTTD